MKKATLPIFALLSACFLTPPVMAETRLGDSCDLSVLGVDDNGNFHHFDNALREAVTSRNAAALAALVQYPVRLNYKSGAHVDLGDAATLQGHAATLWPILQTAVIGQQPGELFCNADGVMYGDGTVWVNPDSHGQRFRISALNLPVDAPARNTSTAAAPARPAATGKTMLACHTNKFHIVIDAAADEQPRYRSWNRPHLPPDEPAMNLVGEESGEGSGPCFHRIWRFRNGNTDYIVSEPGCDAGDAPANAKARLEVDVHGKQQLESWCH